MTTSSVYLVTGANPALVGNALSDLLEELTGGGGFVVVEEFGPSGAGGATTAASTATDDDTADDDGEPAAARGPRRGIDLGPVLDACSTPPFLSDVRIVAVRQAHLLDAAQLKTLGEYLADPLPTTALVLSSDDKPAPAALAKLAKKHGTVIDTDVRSGAKARGEWFEAHLKGAPVKLKPGARALLADNLGEDLARLPGLLDTLASAYGEGATVDASELEPFLGEKGDVAPWDLTDAIDSGDIDKSLVALHRMISGGERHPLVVLAVLHKHFGSMLRLDGSGIDDEGGAASALGMSPYPAGKILRQSRDLGHERVARAIHLLATADLDLRGRSDLAETTTLEVLVARLAQLRRGAPSRGARPPARPRR